MNGQELRTFYYSELSKRLGVNYIKEGKKYAFCIKLYEILENDKNASQLEAINRAKFLFEDQKHLPYHNQNPVTKVFELVEALNKNLKK